jgi:acetyltransferase-like isoleucine patch superfamily enzyme
MDLFSNFRGTLKLGKFCWIEKDCRILLDANAELVESVSSFAYFSQTLPAGVNPVPEATLTIGNDVYIGKNVILLAGIKIGNGAIIAANSFVTKDVAAYATVAGNPAKVVKTRFGPKQVDKLEKIQWWNWSREEINQCSVLLRGTNVAELFKYARDKKSVDV